MVSPIKEMDLLKTLKEEVERKRKSIAEFEVGGKKFIRQADILLKHEEQYRDRQRMKQTARVESSEERNNDMNSLNECDAQLEKSVTDEIPISEVRKRLRDRGQPIILFGESESQVRTRLLKLEIEQPDMKEGWKNEMQTAMRDVDDELVKEVIEGSSNDPNKHDVDLSSSFNDNWEKIEEQATLLGVGNDPHRDCDIILSFFKYLITRWGKELNKRDDDEKKSPAGKLQASIHKQSVMNLKPLLTSLENHTCNNDIRHHLTNICRLLIIDRNYILANNAYMTMAIGNAPWPVGVTRSGIHQRPGSAKAYVSNIAHVLNDETQRKYIQAFKRLMTRMQEYFPTDPSKCVEYFIMSNSEKDTHVDGEEIEDLDSEIANIKKQSTREILEYALKMIHMFENYAIGFAQFFIYVVLFQLSHNPCDRALHYKLMLLLRKNGDLDDLAKLREETVARWPFPSNLWIEWVQDERSSGSNTGRITDLFERAVFDSNSLDVWMEYVQWACGIDSNFAREIFHCSYCRRDDKDEEQVARVNSLYRRALRVPSIDITDIWKSYLEFAGIMRQIHLGNNIDEGIRSSYEVTTTKMRDISAFEIKLAESDESVQAYHDYLNYEKGSGDPVRIQSFYERILERFPEDEGSWFDYGHWCETQLKIHATTCRVYRRAVRHCPYSCALWQQTLLALERSGASEIEIDKLWTDA
ncbi:Prp18 domain protein, partial [Dictyocaulus viviparus]